MGKPGPDEIPDWDVALESLIRDEVMKLSTLGIEDLKRLAKEHAIRLDDIMATLVQLVQHGRWQHQVKDAEGNPVPEDQLQDLYVYSRVDDKMLEKYVILWSPVPGVYS